MTLPTFFNPPPEEGFMETKLYKNYIEGKYGNDKTLERVLYDF